MSICQFGVPYNSFRFVLFRFDLFRFVSICFVSFRSVSFRFDLFRFVSFCFVSFRFVSVSFRTLQGPWYCTDEKDLYQRSHSRINMNTLSSFRKIWTRCNFIRLTLNLVKQNTPNISMDKLQRRKNARGNFTNFINQRFVLLFACPRHPLF